MFCTLLIASTLTLSPVVKPNYNTVAYFDSKTQISQRVLNRTICKDIERVYPLTTNKGFDRVEEKVNLDRNAARKSVEKHCMGRVRSEGKDASECKLTK